ncbi:glycosyltransferase [Fragilaria crotonensis]|nr:glycosyltransferase [Fragilaria crotonensis]
MTKKWHNAEALHYAIRNKNYGMASDILRLELLYEHGGLYVDIDYLCVASVADLHRQFDFYCGASNTGAIELNNGLMASQPRHFVIQKMMERIRDSSMPIFRQQSRQQEAMRHIASFLDNNDTMSRAVLEQGMMTLTPEQVIRHTGPGLLTSTMAEILMTTPPASSSSSADLSRVAILPYQVFHPLPNHRRRLGLEILDEELLEGHIVPGETKAVHLWQCSWQECSQR